MPDAPEPKRKTLQVTGERQESQLCRWEGIRRDLEGRVGFEPTTPGLKVRSSSAELPARSPRIIAIFGHPRNQDARLADQLPTK